MPITVGILTFMSMINFMLISVEYDKVLGPRCSRRTGRDLYCPLSLVLVFALHDSNAVESAKVKTEYLFDAMSLGN